MLKGRLHILLFVTVSVTVMLISYISFRYLYLGAAEKLWASKMESGARESREIGRLLEQQLQSGLAQEKVIHNLQESIENTDTQSEFICMYDKNGVELCHPNPALIGQKIVVGNSMLRSANGTTPFNEAIAQQKSLGGIRSFGKAKNRSSEIVNIYPVKGSDWIVAAHTNIEVLQAELSSLYNQFLVCFLTSALIIIGSCLFLIRQIYGRYEKEVSLEINQLNEKVNTLAGLNDQLAKLQHEINAVPQSTDREVTRKRIITYLKDELIHLDVNEIAFFFLDGAGVRIVTHNDKKYTTTLSLDELMKQLDDEEFYRANRQFIISLQCIKTIYLYGKNQLKIVIKPEPDEAILISKNKVSEFKKWLDR
ncbi:MAG: LytTR family transcriptional regulator [Pedobacter sp.]|nr:MAG: LytTR family transcriptional regulator [Pedobacter sp.]